MVLPTPTLSAIRIFGSSDLMSFKAGRNWYGTKSILAAFSEYKLPADGLLISYAVRLLCSVLKSTQLYAGADAIF